MSSVDRMDIAKMLVMIGGTLGIIGLKSGIKSLVVPSVIASGSAIALTIYDIVEYYKMQKSTIEFNKAIKRQEELEEEMKKVKEYMAGLGD